MRWIYVLVGYGILTISSFTYEATSGNWKPVLISAIGIIINLILLICSLLSSGRVARLRMAWREAYWEEYVILVEKRATQQAIMKMLIRSRLN